VIPIAKTPKPASVLPLSLISKVLEDFVALRPMVIPHSLILFGGFSLLTNFSNKLLQMSNLLCRFGRSINLYSRVIPKTITRSCLIEVSKAFDLIDHSILLRKLQILNVPPILLNW